MTDTSTVLVQRCLDRLRAGDAAARDELVGHAAGRLQALTRKLMGDFRALRRWEESGDVLQNAVVRLCRALAAVVPPTPRDFYRLAAAQIRRELIDLSRHHFGPHGGGANHASAGPDRSGATPPAHDPGQDTTDPARVAQWTDFHRQVDLLPDELREVFDLLWYQGLTQEEAAGLIGVSVRTVKSRWRDARLRLADALGDGPPG